MKIKKKFTGSFIFDKEFNRMIEIKEDNVKELSKFKHLFDDIPKKSKRKHDRGNGEGTNEASESELPI